jgi:uncharacterized tellurite resistance protein B-like protein
MAAMFADFLRRLGSPSPQPLPDSDARLALTALLVRVAKADAQYSVEEIRCIDRIIATRYGLNPVEAAQLRAQAEHLEHEAPDTVRFTRAIKDAIPFEERLAVIEALWDIVLADGEREEHEMALLRLVAPMLGIADQDSAHARRRVSAARGLAPD